MLLRDLVRHLIPQRKYKYDQAYRPDKGHLLPAGEHTRHEGLREALEKPKRREIGKKAYEDDNPVPSTCLRQHRMWPEHYRANGRDQGAKATHRSEEHRHQRD